METTVELRLKSSEETTTRNDDIPPVYLPPDLHHSLYTLTRVKLSAFNFCDVM
jgi:hypothetical protein